MFLTLLPGPVNTSNLLEDQCQLLDAVITTADTDIIGDCRGNLNIID